MNDLARFARASAAAYMTGADQQAALAAIGLIKVAEVDAETDTHAYAATDSRLLVIAFRGTADWKNALTDAEAIPIDGIHEGFRRAYISVQQWVETVIMEHPELTVVFTGHSLGAAIATLAAYHHNSKSLIYTYGSPRVGLGGFVSKYEAKGLSTTRVVHHRDIVPTVPLWPFSHVCYPLKLDDSGKQIPECWQGLQTIADLDGEAVKDHYIDKYINACERYQMPIGVTNS